MKRRDILKGTLAAGATASIPVSITAPAYAQGKRKVKMVTPWPKNFPGLGTGAERVARTITAMTDGRLDVHVYAAGELVPALEAFDAVSGGVAELYHGTEYYWQGKSQAFNFYTGVPYGLTAAEHAGWIYHGGGQELWDKLSAGFNLKPFLVGNTGIQMGGWFNKRINGVHDFNGLKIRIPGLGGEVYRRMGAAAVTLPGAEIFPAMQSGAIDATDWVGPWNDLAFGLYKVAKHYYYPGWQEPSGALSLGINLNFWNDLSKHDQAIIEEAAAAEHGRSVSEFNAENSIALDVLRDKHGVKLERFPEPVLTELGRLSGIVVKEAGATDAVTGDVFESYKAFRARSVAWAKYATQAVTESRLLPFPWGE